MVIEEEELKSNNHQQQQQQLSSNGRSNNYPSNNDGDSKQLQLRQFHERNQQFLSKLSQAESQESQYQEEAQQSQYERSQTETQQSQYQQSQVESQQSQYQQQSQVETERHQAEAQQYHQEIYSLQEEVRALRHELCITQDTHQMNKDQSRAEITMLHTELERQNSRHELIVASLRNRLVESEMARMKMQDQLSHRMEEDATREDELKSRWKSMTTRVLEDKKWVDEQMNYWKESMEEHRKRLSGAKVRGGLDATLGNGSSPPSGSDGKSSTSKTLSKSSGSIDGEEMKNRRMSQRRLWGAYEEGEEEEEDEEEVRMFGKSRGN